MSFYVKVPGVFLMPRQRHSGETQKSGTTMDAKRLYVLIQQSPPRAHSISTPAPTSSNLRKPKPSSPCAPSLCSSYPPSQFSAPQMVRLGVLRHSSVTPRQLISWELHPLISIREEAQYHPHPRCTLCITSFSHLLHSLHAGTTPLPPLAKRR